jgi:F-type H+-transporting ATPase subunit delta
MPETFDKHVAAVEPYAEALFRLACAAGRSAAIFEELQELLRLYESEPGFAAFMTSKALDAQRRAAGLERMFRGRLDDLTLNTLLVMNRHGRHGLLAALLRAYELCMEHAAGEVEVQVTSAVELDAQMRRQIEQTAAELTGKTPRVRYTQDPELLGGLVVQIGDWRYDNSVRRQLRAARARMLERSERGIELTIQNGE